MNKESLQVWLHDDIFMVKNEFQLLSMMILIIARIDPDFLVSFDLEKRGIRYLCQRGFAHGVDFASMVSRACELDDLFQFLNFREFQVVKATFLTPDILLKGNILEHKQNNKKVPQLAYL